jgi:imidazole glycerol-phosphate synthase subunit HisH
VIGIIDYEIGNLKSVFHAFEFVGAEVEICTDPSELGKFDKLVLPGVGTFHQGMKNLESKGWIAPLNERVLTEKIPVLGLCLGMQLMADRGFEVLETKGLGWIPGVVRPLPRVHDSATGKPVKIPHIGWNNVDRKVEHPIFQGIPDSGHFYYVHSFHYECENEVSVIATTDYGQRFSAVVASGHIVGAQFHPEKSQTAGIQLIENFFRWEPVC